MILIFITFFTFIKLGGDQEPEAVARSTPTAAGRALDRHVQFASTDQPRRPRAPTHEDRGQRPAVRVALQLPRQGRLLAYTDMVVPVGMTVLLDITADDVIHSWWIPKLGGKMDAVPGLRRTRPGSGSRRAIKEGRSRSSTRASAPSCAAATTPTCTPA